MNVFFKNKIFRQMTLNSWVSSFGDTLFYLAFINYISSYKFAPLAILLVSISETLPNILGFFFGSLADFQRKRIQKYLSFSFLKIILYTIVFLVLIFTKFTIWSVVLICIMNLVSDTISSFNSGMVFPIYLRILKDDVTEAMGFAQATNHLVSVLGNFSGAILIGILSIQSIAGINVLTFVFAFLGILFIKNMISNIENEMTINKQFSLKNYLSHMKDSLKKLALMSSVVKILIASGFETAVLNTVFTIIVLVLIKNPFMTLKTGQAVSLLTVVSMLSMILGNLLTSKIFTRISLKRLILLSQVFSILVIIGCITYRFEIVLVAMAIASFISGLDSPRFRSATVKLIPEEAMGAIQSAISLLDIVFPSILMMVAVFFATSISIEVASIFLFFLVIVSVILVLKMENLEY